MVGVSPPLQDFWGTFAHSYQRAGILQALAWVQRQGHRGYGQPGGRLSGAILRWPTGSGKSFAAAQVAEALARPTVFITPAHCRLQLAGALTHFTGIPTMAYLPQSKRKRGWTELGQQQAEAEAQGAPPWFVLGWSNVVTDGKLLPELALFLAEYPDALVVLDEVHHMADHRMSKALAGADGRDAYAPITSTAAVMRRALRGMHTGPTLGMSATPSTDRPSQLWGVLDAVQPFSWGKSRPSRQRYAGLRPPGPDEYGEVEDPTMVTREARAELRRRMAEVIHSVPYSTIRRYMPPKRYEVFTIGREDQGPIPRGARRTLKAAQKAQEGLEDAELSVAAWVKTPATVARCLELLGGGEKILLFTEEVAHAEELGLRIGKGFSGDLWVGHGGHSAVEREQIRQSFIGHPGPCILVGTRPAWGEGIDLYDASRTILAALPWTHGDLLQVLGRGPRLASKRPWVGEFHRAVGTRDDRVFEKIIGRLAELGELLPDEALDAVRDGLRGTTGAEVLSGMLARFVAQCEGPS